MEMREMNEDLTEVIDLSGTDNFDYDDWLGFFRKIPAYKLQLNVEDLEKRLPSDGYAALRRWLDIFENPSKMERLYKGRLDKQQESDIMDVALADDDERFYEALILQNVAQLNSSSVSPQEAARLTQNINIFRKELRSVRSMKPNKDSALAKILEKANQKSKKPVVIENKPAKKTSKTAGATKTKKSTKNSGK